MMRLATTVLLTLAILGTSRVLRAEPPDPAAVTEDIKAAFERGDYQETLRLLGRALALKGKAAEGYDRYELLMLRVESNLKLKSQTAALSALEEAIKVAKEAEHDQAVAEARALTTLIKRSKALQYTPKTPAREGKSKGPLDISDPKQREDALEALYLEEKAAAKPKVQAADKGKTLVPVATALKAAVALKDLEIAATGKDVETAETVKDLVDRAHKLMARGLDDMTRRSERIAERANQIETYTVTRRDGTSEQRTRRRGLANEEQRELKDTIATCKRIVQSCKELTESFTDDTEPFDDLVDQAIDTGERAHEVLTDNYSR